MLRPDRVNSETHIHGLYPVSFAFHQNGKRITSVVPSATHKGKDIGITGSTKYTFMCPIYSGLIGLLMPEKKLLPLYLLHLDIDFVFNPTALYSSYPAEAGGSRSYVVSNFYIYGNTFFFEQEIHRTLEASVADHGLFIYCNSFHHAPLQLFGASNSIPSSI